MTDYADRAHAWAHAYLAATGRHPSPGKIRAYASAPVESLGVYRVQVWDAVPDHARGLPEVPGGVVWQGERPDPATKALLKRLAASGGPDMLTRSGRSTDTFQVRPLEHPAWAILHFVPPGPWLAISVWGDPADLRPRDGLIVWRDRYVHQVTRPGRIGGVDPAGEPGTRYEVPSTWVDCGGRAFGLGQGGEYTRHGHLISRSVGLSVGHSYFHGRTWCMGQAQPMLSAAVYDRDWQGCANLVWGVMSKHNPEMSQWSYEQARRTKTARKRTKRAILLAIEAGPFAAGQ